MHDDLLERRLRAALHDEAGMLAFTITAAELERRMAHRRRPVAISRFTLLLAAAIGLSAFGLGGALAGWFVPRPAPTQAPPTLTAVLPSPTAGTPTLPSLDDLVAVDPGSIIVAQAHGPADGSTEPDELPFDLPAASVSVGTFEAGHDYRVSYACLGASTLRLEIGVPLNRGELPEPPVACDGSMREETFNRPQLEEVGFSLSGHASWRIVVRGDHPGTASPDLGLIPPPPAALQPQVSWSQPVDPHGLPFGNTGLIVQQIGSLPTREVFEIQTLCTAQGPIRLIFGSQSGGEISAKTETFIACDPALQRGFSLRDVDAYVGDVFLAAAPDQQVAVQVSSEAPPIELVRKLPGWTISGGTGPDFHFDTATTGFSGAGAEKGGSVMVVVTCTGTAPIEVTVDIGKRSGSKTETFTADCSPDGARTGQSFLAASYVSVDYTAHAMTWAAMSILIPDTAAP